MGDVSVSHNQQVLYQYHRRYLNKLLKERFPGHFLVSCVHEFAHVINRHEVFPHNMHGYCAAKILVIHLLK